jgi:uncharacterized membrane protein
MQTATPARYAAERNSAMPWLWVLVGAYAVARVTQAFPDRIPIVWIVALHVLIPLAFAMVHGAMIYRTRGIVIFILLSLVIGNIFENLGVRTGFPFGHYHFTSAMGPKLFQIPILLGLAYCGVGYLAWTLAGILLGHPGESPVAMRIVYRPLIAAVVMTAWDLAMDPVWANLVHAWIWENGGAYFGVPVSNFLGWYLTNFLIYLSFALLVRRRSPGPAARPRGFWSSAVVCYGVVALGNLYVLAPRGLDAIRDASGATWRVSSMMVASAVVSIGVMGGITALAAWRLQNSAPGRATPPLRPCA